MEKLKSGLLKVIKSNKSKVSPCKKTEEEYFKEYYDSFMNKTNNANNASNSVEIPVFFKKVCVKDAIGIQLRDEARTKFLHWRTKHLLDNDELKALWMLLDKHQSASDDQLMSYRDYKRVRSELGPKGKHYMTASLFAKLQQNDREHRVEIMALFNYVMRKVWLHQTRIGLSLYDQVGHGYLKESDLETYILDLIPTLSQLDGLEKSFHKFYVCTAVRKFLFFLDPLRTGKIRILDVLASGFLDDLLELRDANLPKDSQDSNWFSASSALQVYGQYLNLDTDHNGLLSKEELAAYGSGLLTPLFIRRVFQQCLTYDGEMDYKTYLDFVLALDYKEEPQSLQYLFKILDIDERGYLDGFSLNYFYRGIHDFMTENKQEPVSFEDVKDELFDMIKPKNPDRITLEDLIQCKQGDTAVSILIDLNSFWSHESREAYN